MTTNRNLDDVICGICGVCPEICLGDGNEKNCCTDNQVYYTKDNESRKKMIQLEEFLARLRYRWIEKTVCTRTNDKFTIAIEEIPPIIAPALTGNAVNTEVEKKSVYLKSAQPTGDPAILHKLISEGDIDVQTLDKYKHEFIVETTRKCGIHTGGKSKQYLCGMLCDLYGSILVGNCPCHGFGKTKGKTGGFYHLLCRHGNQPVVFINDTPCGFVRHLECRDPVTSRELWGNNAGCFEKPTIGKQPEEHQNVPAIVPPEYSDGSSQATWEHLREGASNNTPSLNKQPHFVLGDRFHNSTEPHKSPLCQYHNIDLCSQANTIKTSTQESQNNRKNKIRLRSSCMQNLEVHVAYNFLMDYYQNEEIVDRQRQALEKTLKNGEKLIRHNN